MPRRSPFPRLRVSLIAVGALIVAMALVLLFLPGGGSSPDLAEVARVAALPADGPPPPPGREAALGWRPTGSRTDRVNDRVAVTVRYARGPARATVTVVEGDVLSGSGPAGIVVRETAGRTRVVMGTGASRAELADLGAAVGDEVEP